MTDYHTSSAAPPNAAAQFVAGVGDIWRGLMVLIGNPGLWIWAIIPFILSVLIFFGLLAGANHFIGPWLDRQFFAAESSWWMNALGGLVTGLVWIVMLLLVLFLFVPIASVVAAPFNDILSEKVEVIIAGPTAAVAAQGVRGTSLSIWISIKSTVFLTARTLLLLMCVLPLYLIPVFGSLLAASIQAVITIRYLSLEYTSYSMDRRFYTYPMRRAFLEANRPRTLGLGTMAFFIMLVPVVNAIFIPVSAIAGTLLYCDTELKRR